MYSFSSAQHGRKRIAYGKVIIVVRMKIEVGAGITLLHLAEILYNLQGVHYPQGVWKHEPTYTAVGQGIDHGINILW